MGLCAYSRDADFPYFSNLKIISTDACNFVTTIHGSSSFSSCSGSLSSFSISSIDGNALLKSAVKLSKMSTDDTPIGESTPCRVVI